MSDTRWVTPVGSPAEMKKMMAELRLLLLLSSLILICQCGPVFSMLCVRPQSLQAGPTLYDTMDCSLSGSSFNGILQARYWRGLSCPPLGDLPCYCIASVSSVQSFSCIWLFATPWSAARQASLSITNSQSLLKLMPIESMMPSNHLILCHPLLLPPSFFPSIRVFSKWVSSV